MARRLFLLLFSALIGIITSPEILMASDNFTPIGLNNAGVTETVPIVIEEPEPEPVYVAPRYVVPTPVYTAPSNNISVAGRTLEIVDVANTTIDAGSHVNKYGDRFLYGHNTANVFGGLTSLGVGSTFSVTYGGMTTNYRVAKVVIYEKNASTGRLQIDGVGNYMRPVANAKSDGVQYDLSLMTCYGTSYGNGDASHRLVIFANSI